ncbi:MAG: hypothetical protein Q9159_005088 [Coniocarpon cinnabarinum]
MDVERTDDSAVPAAEQSTKDASGLDATPAQPDLPPSDPVQSDHNPGISNTAHHIRNNESFSRSRTSTDASMDLLNAPDNVEDTLRPESQTSQHEPVPDFDAAFAGTQHLQQDSNGSHQRQRSAMDDFNAAFEPKEVPQPEPEMMPAEAAPIIPTMASELIAETPSETVEELQQPIMHPEQTNGLPALEKDTDFGEALKEVAEDLDTAQVTANSATDDAVRFDDVDNDWLRSETEQEPKEEDAWAQALGSIETKKDEPSWDSAFADGLDDEGFLEDDDDGFLEDEDEDVAQSEHVPIKLQQPPSARSTSYFPDGVKAQQTYAPLLSSPSTPAQQPMTSPFAPAPPLQAQANAPDQKHITKFFEDLPVTQRVRKSKQQIVPPSGARPPAPANPPMGQQRPPPYQNPPSSIGSLQPPQKLDLFPPQPTLSPDGPTYTGQATAESRHRQTHLSATPRYSPAPASSPSTSSRYSAAPTSSVPPTNMRYSPAPTAPQPPVPHKDAAQISGPSLSQKPSLGPRSVPAPSRQVSSRYSPAPGVTTGLASEDQPSPSVNYSPSDSLNQSLAGPLPSLTGHKFAPRTSSPLAQPDSRPALDRSNTAPAPPPPIATSSPESIRSQPPATARPPPPPKFDTPTRPRTSSPERSASKYAPQATSEDRRASLQEHPVISPASARQQPPAPALAANAHPSVPFRTRGPSVSDNVEFVQPIDAGQQLDPLQRWKGAPHLHWSSGTVMVTHFPKRDLRFGGGQTAPACKSSAGDLRISKIRERMPVDESLTSFPGPLRSKSKKKELLVWLSSRIDALQTESASADTSMDARFSERLLLWKLMRIFVEHDGVLSGNPIVDNAVRQALVPPQAEPISGRHSRSASNATAFGQPSTTNPLAVSEIRAHLLSGDGEKAVWHAVDNKLWGHAMLIASTAEGTLWKQVSHEFVRSEVRNSSSDRKSLAALYSVMAQNFDESIDELVPASARAGFQMMPTADSGVQGQNTVEGLNKWQETLSLIVSNRSPQDELGIVALGKLLRDYGRTEAAHICFLFAPSIVHLGGLDDSEAHFSLLGADVARTGGQDIDAMLLTEVYEFGLSLRPNAGTQYIPHLQAYKLHHAHMLADAGLRSEGSQYCDAISTAIKSMTRPSPYYHPALILRLEDLNQRLSQTPKDSSSWISKPAVGKVSGSVWARFNSFVAGDDDAASNGSGPQSESEAGPFARMPVGTPTISRNASHADLSAFTPMGAPPSMPPPGANSRYAPSHVPAPKLATAEASASNNAYQPSSYQPNVEPSAPRDIPKPSNYTSPPTTSDTFGQSPSVPMYNPYHSNNNHLGISDTASITSSSYDPPILHHPGLDPPYGSPSTTFSDRATSSHGVPHEDMPAIEEESSAPQHENGYANGPVNGYSPAAGSGYEPPGSGGYAPPGGDTGYVPYEPQDDSPPPSAKPNKQRSMLDADDNDDLTSRAARLKLQPSQPSGTRAPSEAVRLAAEADAERDRKEKEARKASGWFGGWFGGKKDPNAPTVHKAKLGEENSFYFDPDLKRWVNKKAPASEQSSTAGTPPPPKAAPKPPGPTSNPSLGPPSRSATPARSDASNGSGGEAPPGVATGGPPSLGGAGPPSNPPSRPPMSMSNASNGVIDDLLQPGGRRGGTAKKGKRRQVVNVMDQS